MLAEILERHLREIQGANAPVPQMPSPAPTPKQIQYFQGLLLGKQMTDDQRVAYQQLLLGLTKRTIAPYIESLIQLPWAPRVSNLAPKAAAPKIANGYYAVVVNGVLTFYRVNSPTRGNWVGYTFISQVSGDNAISIRDRQERELILGEIAKDPTEALKRFGKEIGQCGHCRKQLTDAVSREFGIGPVCRKMLGL